MLVHVFDAAAGLVLKTHFSLHLESHLVFPCCFAVTITWHTWCYLGTNWAKGALIEVFWNWRASTMKLTTYWRKHRQEAERLETRWTQDVISNTVVSFFPDTWNYRTRTEIAWDREINQYSDKINIRKCTKSREINIKSKITYFRRRWQKRNFENILFSYMNKKLLIRN